MKKMALMCIASCFFATAFAQTDYRLADAAVNKLGAMPSLNVAAIADTITAPFADNELKARAIFFWIANNIAIDPKGTKNHDDKNNLPEKVIELRKATPLGFSLLVQEMCSDANIRCISVDGYTKNAAVEINDPSDEVNHSWNVIQLGKSPETWYFADACRASGYLDEKMTMFTKQFTPGYFFADKKMFNLVNFPDNPAWLLGGAGIKSIKDFYALPVINNYAFGIGLSKPVPLTGYIKTNLKKPVSITFNCDSTVKEITIVTGEERRQSKPEAVKFDNSNGAVSFSYLFKKEITAPMRVFADGKQILEYMVEVTE